MSKLSDEFYKPLENEIVASSFWTYPNSPYDADYNTIHGESVDQTEAAETLGDILRNYFRKINYPVVVIVRSPDVEMESNKGYLIGKDHRYYPDKIVLGGEMGMSNRGVLMMYLNLGIFNDDFNKADINPASLAAEVASVIRHEIIHAKQYDKRAKSQKITRTQAKKEFERDGSIPQSGNRELYLSSHIEVDAYAHEFAENLLRKHGKDKALNVLRGLDDIKDFKVPDQLEEYFEGTGGQAALDKLRGKMYSHIIDMHNRKLFEAIIKRLLTLG